MARSKNTKQCSLCDKVFPSSRCLKRHQVVHTLEKPFRCVECSKDFSQEASLKRHRTYTHNPKAKKFICPKCGTAFAQKYNLGVHLKKQHPLKVPNASQGFPCSKCNCIYRKMCSLGRHMNAHHIANKNVSGNTENVEDLDALVKNTLEQLKLLQNMQEVVSRDVEITKNDATRKSMRSPVDIADLDTSNSATVELKDDLNPQREVNLIKVRRILKENGVQYYLCDFCEKEFRYRYNYIKHRRKHTNERPYRCSICIQSFRTQTDVNRHQTLHILDHQEGTFSRQHMCCVCNDNFPSMRQLDNHMKSHSTMHNIQYSCEICSASFSTKTALSGHKHYTFEDYEMQYLNSLIPKPIDLTERRKIENLKPSTEVSLNFQNSQKKLEFKKYFKCPTCLRYYASRSSLYTHKKIHHSDISKRYNCVHCVGKKFHTRAEQQRHLMTHSTSRNFKCVYCVKTFKTKQNCRSHMKTHIKQLLNGKISRKTLNKVTAEKPRKHACPQCDKSFTKPSDLKRHTDIHSAVRSRPYVCQKCDKAFASKTTLKYHELTHNAERKRVMCNICGKLYASKKALTIHIRLHTDERPLKCNHCEQTFRTSAQRIAHLKKVGLAS